MCVDINIKNKREYKYKNKINVKNLIELNNFYYFINYNKLFHLYTYTYLKLRMETE